MPKQKALCIFEGGGLKGIAHTGAYAALCESNMFDVAGIAGTSAGAIVAALVAAGVQPDKLKNAIESKDVREFLDDDYRDLLENKEIGKLLTKLGEGGPIRRCITMRTLLNQPFVRELLDKKGIHSGEAFVKWFKQILKNSPAGYEDVTFRDVAPRNLKIIATDLSARSLVVFNSKDTPNTKLWEAVRASISIPFFFKPFRMNGRLLVDGGLLSNFPAWVFDQERETVPCPATIGFRLKEPPSAQGTPETFLEFLKSFLETSLSGNDLLQYRGIPGLTTVNLPTEGVDWLDFDIDADKKQRLYDSAFRETQRALRQEFRVITYAQKINELLVQAGEEMVSISKAPVEPGRKRIRTNVMVKFKWSSGRKVIFSYNMEGDDDAELELEMNQGGTAYAWQMGSPRAIDLQEVERKIASGEPYAGADVYNYDSGKTSADSEEPEKPVQRANCKSFR